MTKRKILKAGRGKKRHIEEQRMKVDFSSENIQTSNNGMKSLKYCKKKKILST